MTDYPSDIHQVQMAASRVSDECLMAMGADKGNNRDYHVKEALHNSDEMLARLAILRATIAGQVA